ncbi:hypothetical protein FV222_09855 [Methylobacterium sp. WL103]|uniref:hypothetical protein n=1 Tax=Methylobacterium sp. WL103 TaxID=2603891 RepID=UPI0011C809F5|nr:hypothetical protein [Methylobacterium sp. WL103]TXN02155.1 hypothetical protein FV222_09855 [Methylobacterium sp. WL103]
MTDMTKPAFQPAPRPRPRTSPEEAQQLAASTSDLGFSRTSSAPEAGPTEAPTPEPISTKAQAPKSPIAPVKGSALKFEVPDEVWTALRQEALNRRVTVKYLVLEALAAKGYNVDLSAVPEDGRRIR